MSEPQEVRSSSGLETLMTKRKAQAMLWRAAIYCVERRMDCPLTAQSDWEDWNWASATLELMARRIYSKKKVPHEGHDAE